MFLIPVAMTSRRRRGDPSPPPPPLEFADPLVPAEPWSRNTTGAALTTNSATISAEGIAVFSWQAGSTALRSISSIEGSGEQPVSSLGLATGLVTGEGNRPWKRIAAYRASVAGTYTVDAVLTDNSWTGVGLFLPIEGFTVIEAITSGHPEDVAGITHDLANTVQDEDLVLSFCSVRTNSAFSVPSGMAALAYAGPTDINISPNNQQRFRAAWRRGGGATVTWSPLTTGAGQARAALTLHLRRAA